MDKRRKINLDVWKNKEYKVDYDEIGRIYQIHNDWFHSVTTVLGITGDKSFLENWKKRIGEKSAEKVTRQAGKIGTEFHSLGEAWMLNQKYPNVQWLPKHLFDKAVPILQKNITEVHAVEMVLFSIIAKIAGRVDAIIDWNNDLTIFDFKCINHLNPEWLQDYWLQTTIYKLCLQEMTGYSATKLVLFCANKKSLQVKTFEESPQKFIKPAADRIKKFRKLLNSF